MLLLVLAGPSAASECQQPKLLRVHDGDTVSVRCAQGGTIKLRLGDIDAPELAQPHGRAARTALQNMLKGGPLTVQTRATDRYGRRIGDLRVAGDSASLRLVEQGLAWCGRRAPAACKERQQRARKARRGLWQEEDPMPPWRWRQLHPRRD